MPLKLPKTTRRLISANKKPSGRGRRANLEKKEQEMANIFLNEVQEEEDDQPRRRSTRKRKSTTFEELKSDSDSDVIFIEETSMLSSQRDENNIETCNSTVEETKNEEDDRWAITPPPGFENDDEEQGEAKMKRNPVPAPHVEEPSPPLLPTVDYDSSSVLKTSKLVNEPAVPISEEACGVKISSNSRPNGCSQFSPLDTPFPLSALSETPPLPNEIEPETRKRSLPGSFSSQEDSLAVKRGIQLTRFALTGDQSRDDVLFCSCVSQAVHFDHWLRTPLQSRFPW